VNTRIRPTRFVSLTFAPSSHAVPGGLSLLHGCFLSPQSAIFSQEADLQRINFAQNKLCKFLFFKGLQVPKKGLM